MIKVRAELKRVGLRQPRTYVTCPQCEEEDFFNSFVYRSCYSCGFEWGNIIALMEDIRVRRYYFNHGEID